MSKPIGLKGAHHIGISVSNFERSLAWYEEHFGFKIRSKTYLPDRQLKIAFIERDGLEIEIFERAGSTAQRPLEEAVDSFDYQGYRHFSFLVEDVDHAWAEAQAHGLDLVAAPETNTDLGVRFCFVKDPDGILLEMLAPI